MSEAVIGPRPAARRSGSGSRRTGRSSRLLVLINAFVGGMVGIERTVVPLIGVGRVQDRFDDARRLLHRQLRRREGASPISSPAISPTLGAASAFWSSAGWSACRFRS